MNLSHNNTTQRNSSIELLRIIAMLFIVLSHACVHSNFDFPSNTVSFNSLFTQFGVLGNLGVDIYVLISGYFLCKKSDNYRSVIRLLLQVWFYSYALFIICHFLFQYSYSFNEYLQVVFPTIFEEYWFFTTYVVLSLLSPYINFFLDKADRRTLKTFLTIMFIIWVLLPTLTRQPMYGGPLMQFLFFYCIGAYFRLYLAEVHLRKTKIAFIAIVSFVLLFASTFFLDCLGQSIPIFQGCGILFYGRDSLLIVSCAISLFAFFINLPFFSNSFVNAVASCTFGVYLIHDNPVVRFILWNRIFKLSQKSGSPYLPIYIITSVCIVFCFSTIIEYIRQRLLDPCFNRISAGAVKKIKQH